MLEVWQKGTATGTELQDPGSYRPRRSSHPATSDIPQATSLRTPEEHAEDERQDFKAKPTQSFRAITELLKGRQGWDTEQVQRHPGPRHQTPSWDVLGAQLETPWYFQRSWAPTGMLATEESFTAGTTEQP